MTLSIRWNDVEIFEFCLISFMVGRRLFRFVACGLSLRDDLDDVDDDNENVEGSVSLAGGKFVAKRRLFVEAACLSSLRKRFHLLMVVGVFVYVRLPDCATRKHR